MIRPISTINMFAYLFVALTLFTGASAQVLVPALCPNVKVVQDFNVSRYLGLWSENARYNLIYERGNCSTATYGPVSDNGVVKVFNREIVNGEESTIEGTAVLANASSSEAKLKVSFNVSNIETVADYWVLGTDYENYSLVWSCSNFGNLFSFQSGWILGRTKPLSPEANATVYSLISENEISTEYFNTHDDANCLKFP